MSDARGAASWDAKRARVREHDCEVCELAGELADERTRSQELLAECGRLREQLATAREALAGELEQKAEAVIRASALREPLAAATGLAKAILDFTENEALDEWDGGSIGYSLGGICSMANDFLAARAALGVEGEPPGDTSDR